MKKISSILLAGLILYNIFGYFFVFRSEQSVLKEEMKGLIRSHQGESLHDRNNPGEAKDFFFSACEQITVSLNDPNFQWVERGEFRFHDKLYDVISQKASGNQIIFTCINDLQEETLLSAYHRISDFALGLNFPGKAKMRTSLLHHLIKVAIVKERVLLSWFTNTVTLFPSEKVFCYQKYIHQENPPPKQA